MRCILVTGTLGSGKTTCLVKLLRWNAEAGFPKPVLIVNDVGRFNVDRERLNTGDTGNILDLTSGCLDCADREAFVAAIRATAQEGKDLFIEPTGAANGDNLADVFRECGITPVIVTLLSAAHFRRNLAYDPKAMESQLRHAGHIALTWLEEHASLDHPSLEEVLGYVGTHAPDAEVHLLPEEQLPSSFANTVLNIQATTAPVLLVCGHGCTHDHDHDHGHSHDHLQSHVRTIRLRSDVTANDLRSLCLNLAGNGLVRAKGSFGNDGRRQRFDFVHGDFTVHPDTQSSASSANFITSQPLAASALDGISDGQVDDVELKPEDAIAAIKYGLKNAWEPLMPNGDIREDNAFLFRAYHRSLQYAVPDALRNRAITTYADWYLRVAKALTQGDWDTHPKLPQWRRRVGVHLTLLAARHADILGQDRVNRIAALGMAHVAMLGLTAFRAEHVTFKQDPVETPADLLEVVRFGYDHESMTQEIALSAFRHCRNLHPDNDVWASPWDAAIARL